jgi:hypothetical protein
MVMKMTRQAVLRAVGLLSLFFPQAIAVANASPALKAPSIVVMTAGFTQARSHGGHAFITYGLALTNRSTRVDAVGVTARMTFVDASGRTIARASREVTVVPARATFYVGGAITAPPSAHAALLRTSITTQFGAQTHLQLAKVTGVAAEIDDLGGWRIKAALTNPYPQPLAAHHATACAVIFSTHGRILGGQCTDIAAALQAKSLAPHARAIIRFSNPGLSILAAGEARAKVSIDPGSSMLPLSLARRLR